MNRPSEDVLNAFVVWRWSVLVKAASSQISTGHRNALDIEQIVNDSVYEWMLYISKREIMPPSTLADDDPLICLLLSIVKRRVIDAIRNRSTWKRGGRIAFEGESALLKVCDPFGIEFVSQLECEEALSSVMKHFSENQQRVIRLSLEGYSEKEIAKQTDSTLSAVTKIRKMFKDFAWTVLTDLALLQQTTDNRQQTTDNRQQKAEMGQGSMQWRQGIKFP